VLGKRGTASGAGLRWIECYCEECFAPARITERGDLCDRHYLARAPICESCGQHPASIVEFGYHVCGSCRSRGAGR
jgi:hypothetical protein